MSFMGISRFRFHFGKGLRLVAGLCSIGVLFAFPHVGQSQALPTASRLASISAFGTGGRLETDYGVKAIGFTFGADVGFYPHFFRLLDPAIDARMTLGSRGQISERTLGGGLKLSKNYAKFHPYAVLGVKYGTISFAPATYLYNHDNSVVYSIGGGLDYPIKGPFALKVDYEYQIWRLSYTVNNLTPSLYTVGVNYTLPAERSHRERRR